MPRISFLLLIAALFLSQCKEPVPLEIKPLKYPADAFKIKPMIPKNLYKSDGNFQTGYDNGKILSDRIALEWQESQSSNFLCYKIFRDNVQQMVISDKQVTSYLDSNLVHNTYYDYRLVHMTMDGMFSSDTLKIKTPRFAKPTNLLFQYISETSIKLHWYNRAESATKFDVFRRLFIEPDSAATLMATTTDTFYVDNNVINSGRYYYHITAYNDFEATEPSDPLFVQVNYSLEPPDNVSAVQNKFDRTVTLTWTRKSTADDGTRIYRRPLGGSYRMIAQVPLTVTEYTDRDTSSTLRIDSTYIYALRSYNSRDESDLSNPETVTIRQPISPRIASDVFIRDESALIKNN